MNLTWLGHNTFEIKLGQTRIVLDPFLNDSPASPKKSPDVEADYVLISHGHADHCADAVSIVQRTGAEVVTSFEVCTWLGNQGVAAEKCHPMNLGGTIELPFGKVTMTIAHHSSSLPDGSYGGPAAGFVVSPPQGPTVYFACDTALFLDMKLIGMRKPDVAVLPIGDVFTMGPEESLEAIKMLGVSRVLPCHYNTWPPIAQDAQQWAESVRNHTAAEPIVLEPGQSIDL